MFGPKSRNPLLLLYYICIDIFVCGWLYCVCIVDPDVFALFVQGRKRNVEKKWEAISKNENLIQCNIYTWLLVTYYLLAFGQYHKGNHIEKKNSFKRNYRPAFSQQQQRKKTNFVELIQFFVEPIKRNDIPFKGAEMESDSEIEP